MCIEEVYAGDTFGELTLKMSYRHPSEASGTAQRRPDSPPCVWVSARVDSEIFICRPAPLSARCRANSISTPYAGAFSCGRECWSRNVWLSLACTRNNRPLAPTLTRGFNFYIALQGR